MRTLSVVVKFTARALGLHRCRGCSMLGAGDVDTNFEIWFLTSVLGQRTVFWRMIFLAVVWAIWRYRNKIVFQGNRFDKDGCFECCRFDLT